MAALVLVVGGAIFLALAADQRFGRGRRRGGLPAGRASPRLVPIPAEAVDRSIVRIVASLSLGAAIIHVASAPHHYAEFGDLGAGFIIAGVFQAAWARAALTALSTRAAWIGIIGNLVIVAAWIISRLVGLPVGTQPWIPETIGLPDGAATIFEVLVVGALSVRLLGIDRGLVERFAPVRSIAAIAVVPALGLVLLTASLAAVAIAAGADHGVVHSPPAGSAHP
jgi:hypothetical protein